MNHDIVHCAVFSLCAMEQDNCSDNAVCTDIVGGFVCRCVSGYQGDGVECCEYAFCFIVAMYTIACKHKKL